MVRTVRTERQNNDCHVKCRITFSFQRMFHEYGSQFDWKISIAMPYILVKVMQDGMACFHLFRFFFLM